MNHGDLLSIVPVSLVGGAEVEDDLLGLVVRFLFDGDMSVKELAGEVARTAARYGVADLAEAGKQGR